MGFAPNQPQRIIFAAATAAGGYQGAYFQPGRQLARIDFTNGSTGRVAFMAQASNSTSGIWFDLKAAASTVAAAGVVAITSTYACVFDRVRIYTSDASATTASTSFTFWVSAR